ncbi:TonB-dependent siderophore receptor [Pseudorhodoferax sp.]|uniref:TonB-dependent siderophore receptor n=1 Tax=Pseudorhodoferax sp. TaxID=1993553 RepID=UPI002DD62493|nr:TonB-dependent siderophore receptor [Pseudorhodoferax sp.]
MVHVPSSLHGVARSALVIALAGIGLGAGLVPPAQAQETAAQQRDYRIAAGPLDEALTQFGRASGLLLSFSAADTAGLRSAGLQGRHSVRSGLDALLAGTGLAALAQPNGAYVLRKASASASAAAAATGSTVLREVRVTAPAERSATTEGSGSLAVRAVSINKGEQALKDIPQSVSVLTRRQLDEQGITDLKVAANSITGVVGAQGVGQGMVLSARGFQIDAWQYDGVAVPRNHYALGNWATEGMVFYDRMEVLRGASGLLQGTGSPGGAVNLVRKRGQAEKTVTITARAGSWDRYGMQLDAGGPLNEDRSLRGRVVLDEARSHSFIDDVNDRTQSLYAALDYDIGPSTTVGLGVSRSDSGGRPMLLGLPVFPDGKESGLPRSTFTGAAWNRSDIEQTTVFADLDHRVNADWKLKVSALRMTEKNSSTHQRMTGDPALNPDGSGLSYDNWITDFDATRVGIDAYVNGRFDALGLRHEVTVGANYSKYTTNDMFARTFTSGANIFAIDHDRPKPTVASLLADGGRQSLAAYDVRQKGIYASWRARLTDPLTAILGARASWYDNIYTNRQTGARSGDSASAEITPYVGLVYALTPQWSAYGSATSVFEPQSARTVAGSVLDPIVGTNVEIGIKGELLDGRVNTSLAAFRYDHRNRAVNDEAAGFACDGWYCSTPSGKVRSQGVEAEVSGEVLRHLQVMAGYTYNTTEYRSDPVNQGQVFSTWTPKHIVRAWTAYQLPGEWSRITLGGGFNIQSHTLSTERTFKVPGFTVWNLRLGYQVTPEVNLSMSLNNVFDKHYVQPGFIGYVGATYGDPRNVMFTLKYSPKL